MTTARFDTKQDALDAGYETINRNDPSVRDTSGADKFGYDFTQYDSDGRILRESVDVSLRQSVQPSGKLGTVAIMWPPPATPSP